jgi:hypothetical protein
MKLDIAKAFDNLRWDFLLEVLHHMGFGTRWCSWVSILLSTASTSVLLNGSRGSWFKHFTGLRQGNPLSPMLFILAMEPPQKMFDLATREGGLSMINNRAARVRMSMYADDVAFFMNPDKTEVGVMADLLDIFGTTSGLVTNKDKSVVYPIQCAGIDIDDILESYQCPIKEFLCTYLGLPLHFRVLRRVDFHPLIDKVAARLSAWRGKLLNKAGRLVLVNTVPTSIPTYYLTVFPLKKWAIKKIDKIRMSFLWKGAKNANGGHCLVWWGKVMRPKKFGGLGILDLDLFSRAMRLRWLSYEWKDPDRPWVGTKPPVTEMDRQLFRASTVVTIGNGLKAEFWNSSWLQGMAPRDIAPNIS